jgi:hypothetical protein
MNHQDAKTPKTTQMSPDFKINFCLSWRLCVLALDGDSVLREV